MNKLQMRHKPTVTERRNKRVKPSNVDVQLCNIGVYRRNHISEIWTHNIDPTGLN